MVKDSFERSDADTLEVKWGRTQKGHALFLLGSEAEFCRFNSGFDSGRM